MGGDAVPPSASLFLSQSLRAHFSSTRCSVFGLLELRFEASLDTGVCQLHSCFCSPVLGEVLYHLRPFVHLYLLKRARNTKSWTPWLAAIRRRLGPSRAQLQLLYLQQQARQQQIGRKWLSYPFCVIRLCLCLTMQLSRRTLFPCCMGLPT